jgi:hypothetical protein
VDSGYGTLKEAFDEFDQHKTKKLSKKDLLDSIRIFGIKVDREIIDYFFNLADITKDGYIQYEEFYRVFLDNVAELQEHVNGIQIKLDWKMELMKQIQNTMNEVGTTLSNLF